MNNNDELYHYGVKGMKWKGHVYATRDELKGAKRAYKAEKKEFKRARNEAKRNAKYEHAANHKVGTIVGGYLKGGLGGLALSAAAMTPLVTAGKMKVNTMANITSVASQVGSIFGVASGAKKIIKGSRVKNVAAIATYGLNSNGVRNDLTKRTVWNEKHSRSKGNI